MRTPLAIRTLLLAAPLLVHCATTRDRTQAGAPAEAAPGVPFRSHPGGYAVRLPAPPKEQTEAKPAGIKLHFASAATPDRAVAYVVGWYDHFPEARAAPERLVDDELKAMVANGDQLVDQRPARVAGLSGRAFRIARKDGTQVHGEMALRDARFFMLLVMGRDPRVSAAAAPFFESFEVTGPGVADPPPAPAPRRVTFRPARVSLELHGEPDRSELPGGAGSMIGARSRGGFRVELAILTPARIGTRREANELLDQFVQGWSTKASGLSDERRLEVAGRPAREFRARVNGADAFARAVALDGGILLLQVGGPPATVDWKEAAAFFESVHFDPPKPAKLR